LQLTVARSIVASAWPVFDRLMVLRYQVARPQLNVGVS